MAREDAGSPSRAKEPAEEICAMDWEPSENIFFAIPSAKALRQVLPEQTKRSFFNICTLPSKLLSMYQSNISRVKG